MTKMVERWANEELGDDFFHFVNKIQAELHMPGKHDQSKHGNEDTQTDGEMSADVKWRIPSEEQLKLEFHVEQELKGNKFWNSQESFLKAVSQAKVETITPQANSRISYRSNTSSKQGLLSLIKSYKSYPEFRNEKTLEGLYKNISANDVMDMPIVIERPNGGRRVFSGNTRMDVAFQLKKNPKVLIVKTDN